MTIRTDTKANLLPVIITALVVMIIAGCKNDNFDPFNREADLHFSIHGALDASLDTQWIRISPVRDDFFQNGEAFDATVTITNTRTGQTVTMNPERFSRFNGEETVYFWNYWTTGDIEAEEEYVLRVFDSEGNESSSTVRIPPDFVTPTFDLGRGDDNGVLIGDGIDRIVVADGIYYLTIYTEEGGAFVRKEYISQVEGENITRSATTGLYRIYFDDMVVIADLYKVPLTRIQLDSAKIYMAAGNDSWPDVVNYTPEELSLPHVVSNIENGVGVLVGINSVTLPFRSCYDQDQQLIACEPLKSRALIKN